MAKLKILDGSGKPQKEAYINVVEGLFATSQSFDAYVAAHPNQRPAILQSYTGNPNWKITQLQTNDSKEHPIDNDNCRILGEKDVLGDGAHPSKVTVPIPVSWVPDFSYLDDYVKIVVDYYNAGDAASKNKAYKFFFGAMLLTHCR